MRADRRPLDRAKTSAQRRWYRRGSTDRGSTPSPSFRAKAGGERATACAVDTSPPGARRAWLSCSITVGDSGAQALVLADEPATSCYLPERRAFLRWLAADSEVRLRAAADAVLTDPATLWEECGTWMSDGPAVLMDSAEAGSDLGVAYPGGGMAAQATVPLPVGRWKIRATHTKVHEENWVGLVQLLPTESMQNQPSSTV
ncbi:Imm21 family immunity protein [Streptomyces sp. NPDC090057]|uniref:Imm21 family immunity protein n=1 Tax=Streptomyces sp. NPDC090057 TaxID=3365935 RepID=UPI00380BE3C3